MTSRIDESKRVETPEQAEQKRFLEKGKKEWKIDRRVLRTISNPNYFLHTSYSRDEQAYLTLVDRNGQMLNEVSTLLNDLSLEPSFSWKQKYTIYDSCFLPHPNEDQFIIYEGCGWHLWRIEQGEMQHVKTQEMALTPMAVTNSGFPLRVLGRNSQNAARKLAMTPNGEMLITSQRPLTNSGLIQLDFWSLTEAKEGPIATDVLPSGSVSEAKKTSFATCVLPSDSVKENWHPEAMIMDPSGQYLTVALGSPTDEYELALVDLSVPAHPRAVGSKPILLNQDEWLEDINLDFTEGWSVRWNSLIRSHLGVAAYPAEVRLFSFPELGAACQARHDNIVAALRATHFHENVKVAPLSGIVAEYLFFPPAPRRAAPLPTAPAKSENDLTNKQFDHEPPIYKI